ERVKTMVDRYMQAGMNYFDTAYVYHGGKSEVAAREALVKIYPRESYMLATKLPAWEIKQESDIERIFNEQCERAGVDYFDF
ncbi:MAG: aldo/keto reductase, partial [Treponema sp.]|nr:aldo/keto reductase [Treponema sp.]